MMRPTTAAAVARPATAAGGAVGMDGKRKDRRKASSIATKASDEAFQRYEEAWFIFHRYDANNSGTIDAQELASILSDLKMHVGRSQRTEEQMQEWVARELKRSDSNGDGELSFDEFVAYYNSFVSRHRSQWDELYTIHHSSELGSGAFGVVVRGERCADKQPVAIKRLSKAGMSKASAADLLHGEIAIWEALEHPNLVKLIDVFEDVSHIILITELMRGGDLFSRLHHQVRV